MATEYTEYSHSRLKETIERLQDQRTDLKTLISLLVWLLASWNILPPKFHRYNTDPMTGMPLNIQRYLPPLQLVLIQHVAPVWEQSLRSNNLQQLLYQYFVPDSIYYATQSAGDVALCAYNTILSVPFSAFSVMMLDSLISMYPIDKMYDTIWGQAANIKHSKRVTIWEDFVRNIIAIPSKTANYLEGKGIPENIQQGPYYKLLSIRFESLLSSLSRTDEVDIDSSPLAFLLTKLINSGLFPSMPPSLANQISFFEATQSIIRFRLSSFTSFGQLTIYSSKWSRLWSLLSITQLNTVLISFFASVSPYIKDETLNSSIDFRSQIKRESIFLSRLMGRIGGEEDEKWPSIRAVLIGRSWDEPMARVLVCWAAESDSSIEEKALQTLLDSVVEIWTSSEHIKHSMLSYHKYMTTLLLTTLSYFPSTPTSPHAQILTLSYSSPFISSIGTYIGHIDYSIRRCGMLVAEEVARLTGKELDFGGWDGEVDNRQWFRNLRQLIKERDVSAPEAEYSVLEEIRTPPIPESVNLTELNSRPKPNINSVSLPSKNEYDSDDSLTGYVSTPTSSRSPSPTPSELEEFEKEPTIHVGKKKIHPPVYLADLGNMLRDPGKADDPQNVDRIEIALVCAEELIRRKKGFGLELEENAINLVYGLIGLQNNYDLDKFDQLRQGAVNALVVCCPRKCVPAMIEEFFKNQYSISQRFVILNGLALGARELGSLPVPPSIPLEKTKFPSKRLPPALHRKLITESNDNESEMSTVHRLASGMTDLAINNGREATEEKLPEFVRERQLRIRKPVRISEVKSRNELTRDEFTTRTEKTTFIELAAEFFISPLLRNFWQHLHDDQERQARTAHREHQYSGTGTALILNPLMLAQILATVAVLMDAARHSPHYLSVLAPDALELAVTLGSRPMSSAEEDKEKEASVLTGSFELALVVLDGCLDLDGGRALGLEHTALVVSIGEWAGNVMNLLEQGARVQGGGGKYDIRLKRATAGVLLKIDELTSKWSRSMLQYV